MTYSAAACSNLVAAITWSSFLSASAMMALVGALIWIVFKRVPVQSYRLRSWLAAAVLLQGMIVVRSPIHLGLIETARPDVAATASVIDIELPDRASDGQGNLRDGQPPDGSMPASQSAAASGLRQQLDSIGWRTTLLRVWLATAVLLMVRAVSRYLRVLRHVRKLRCAPDSWQQQWQALRDRRGVSDAAFPCEMLVSQSAGPMLVRRWKGYTLVVPEGYWRELTNLQRRGVMLHELAHLERFDVWRQLIARLITILHWFNPLAWWALRQYEQASECACDQRVGQDGRRVAAGFAAALVNLVHWHQESQTTLELRRGVGFQSMSAPPLADRVTLLLKPKYTGDSPVKRLSVAMLGLALIAASVIQIRLTSAQDRNATADTDQLRVISEDVAGQLSEIASQLDLSDVTTERFSSLLASPTGKIAVAGYLNALSGRSREEARAEAIPRFVEHHFSRAENGKLVVRPESEQAVVRWKRQSARLSDDIRKMRLTSGDIASKLDTSTEAGGLFKRLLQDPQAPVAVLLNEMDGGDVISRYLSQALDQMLVDQGNGTFRIVESKRREAERQIEQFERADKFSQRLGRELPNLAAEYADDDEAHQRLIKYLRDPLTSIVVAMELAGDAASVSRAVEALHEHFEQVSTDTPAGLKIAQEEAWEKIDEIFGRVDRASSILPRIKEKLGEISATLATDDPLTARLAAQMQRDPVAVLLASELPYAEADPGEELRVLLSDVLSESGGKLSINSDKEEQVAEKARELLQVCRRIRRYVSEIEDVLDNVADRELVEQLGDAGGYTMLNEIRRFAERHRPDPVALMQADLLVSADADKLRVREDRREIVRRLIEQSEQIRAEESIDDF